MSDEAKCPQCGLPRPPERGHLARGYEGYCWRADGDECLRRQLAQRDALRGLANKDRESE